jgi:CRISPR-associated protein (TIGR02710 family)
MKALIVSVGTGTRPTKQAVESLANAIAFSIKHHNPDKTFFIVSQQSLNTTLLKIMQKIPLKNHEIILIENPDDIQKIHEKLQPKFCQIKKKFDQIAVDYTSGTKAMTSALTILGTIYEATTLSYITGERIGGIVQAGTEKLNIVQPYFATTEQKIKTAIQFFNKNQYNATMEILAQIQKTVKDPQITSRIKPFFQLAKAYAQWDIFQHQKAFAIIEKINRQELCGNKRFLGLLLNAINENRNPASFHIADLINNAKRRGEEGKYDDAVARLYRTIELIAQHQLQDQYGITPSKVKLEQIPQELIDIWNIEPDVNAIKLGLKKCYEFLNAKKDPLGKKFQNDKKLQDLLSKRNTSILAHGTTPVTAETYRALLQKTLEYAKTTIERLEQLLHDSAFIKWKG